MKLFKLIALGAAVGYGYNYLTKRDAFGKSKLDQIKENSPGWIEKGKKIASDAVSEFRNTRNEPKYGQQPNL